MKRSKAFVLVEILTGMALQAGFILMLCTSFYLMLSFYTRTQQALNARQKGEKVIAYVDARIRNAGLGLQECESSKQIRDALKNISNLVGAKPYPTLPVSITLGDGSKTGNNWSEISEDEYKIRGNVLTLLYTKRPTDLNMTIKTLEDNTIVSGSNHSVTTISKDAVTIALIAPENDRQWSFEKSEFAKKGTNKMDIDAYTVLSGTGLPLWIDKSNDKGNFTLKYMGSTTDISGEVYPGDELLYLKCERMFVHENNFKFWKFSGISWTQNGNKAYSNEDGILEIYFELDKNNNILDMYVLASGGANSSGSTNKPAIWPDYFWKSEYAYKTVYVSRASWKLSNIKFNGLNWN